MRKITAMLLVCLMAIGQVWAQTRTVTGKVTDESGVPVEGASVTVKGTSVGTTTNQDGVFSLEIPSTAKTLVISSVNFKPQELGIGIRTNFDVALVPGVGNLEEVVVVAYGTQKKPELTGSLAKVSAEQVENRPFTSVDKILQGQVAGLQSVSASGQPGSATDIRIRGFSSITASNSPLWVVDGIPILTGDASRLTTTANLLSTLNPNDIESITVLKDAAASSVYGSRAANGVILVTTKSGKAGKTKFRFDTEVGYSDIAYMNPLYRPLNSAEYFELTREGLRNAGATDAQIANTIAGLGGNNGVDFSWLDNTTRRGTQQSYNLSAQGGNDKTTFSISGGYFQQEGITIQSDFTRVSAALNLRHKVNNKISFFTTANVGIVEQMAPLNGGAFGNPVLSSYFLLPSRAAWLPDGSYNIVAPDFGPGALHNTIYTANVDKRKLSQNSIRGTIGAEYTIIPGLKFTSRYGMDYSVLEEDQYNNPFHGDGFNVQGRAFFFYTRYTNWTWTNLLEYRKAIDKKEDFMLDAKVGYEAQKSTGVFSNVNSQGFPPNTNLTVPAVGAQPITASRTGSDFAFLAAPFSIVGLNYQNKYGISGSFRRDGSSRFGDLRFANFWSVGATWNIDQEAFMADQNIFTQAKLRGSYGTTGNAGIGNYDWRTLYGYGTNYNQQTGSAPSNPGNPLLTWEDNIQTNIGIDLGFRFMKARVTVDWYQRLSENILLDVPTSRTTGFASVPQNIGTMENKGWEFSVDFTPVETRSSFRWNINANLSLNRNKITSLAPGQNEILSGVFIRTPGYDFQTYFARIWAGVDPANGDPLWYTDDTRRTTTNNWNLAQRSKEVGSATPRYFGGATNTFSFKGVSLATQFVFSGGNWGRDTWGGFYTGSGNGAAFNKVYRQYAERWTTPGQAAGMPRYIYNNGRLAQNFSTFFLYRGDFVRIRDLTLAYDFPKAMLSKVGITSLSIYGRGANIWTRVKDKNTPFDPEQRISNETNLEVFIPKTYTIGLNVGF